MGRDGYDDSQVIAAMQAQAEEVLRAYGEPSSQQSEVLAAASVGRAGLALARMVQHWFRQQEHEAMIALMTQPVRIEVTPEQAEQFLRMRAARTGIQEEPDPPIDLKPNPCPYTFAHTRHWCGYEGCRDA